MNITYTQSIHIALILFIFNNIHCAYITLYATESDFPHPHIFFVFSQTPVLNFASFTGNDSSILIFFSYDSKINKILLIYNLKYHGDSKHLHLCSMLYSHIAHIPFAQFLHIVDELCLTVHKVAKSILYSFFFSTFTQHSWAAQVDAKITKSTKTEMQDNKMCYRKVYILFDLVYLGEIQTQFVNVIVLSKYTPPN